MINPKLVNQLLYGWILLLYMSKSCSGPPSPKSFEIKNSLEAMVSGLGREAEQAQVVGHP